MEFEYSEEEKSIRALARDFAEKEVAPGAEERDRTGEFAYDLWRRLGELGLLGVMFPEKYGGSDAGLLAFCLATEELARADASLAVTYQVGVDSAARIIIFGNEEQKAEFIPPVVRGETLGSGGITDPDSGSDLKSMKAKVTLKDGHWVLNGSKAFVTNVGTDITSICFVVARDDEVNGYTTVIVPEPRKMPGFTIMPKYKKMGLKSSDTHEIHFDDVRVPEKNILGERGNSLGLNLAGLTIGRTVVSSCGLGVAQACLDASLAYAQERIAFGQPIFKFQHVQEMLVEMALSIELGRLIRDKTASMLRGKGTAADIKQVSKVNSMCKLFCTETAKKCTDLAISVFAGAGFIDDCPVSRYYRDARALTIVDGTSQIHKLIIARNL